jgi:transcriptional regulator with XRE-family HTH domain
MDNINIKFKTNSELQAELGMRLRRLRLQHNMPRVELAEKAGVAVGSIAKAEAGEDIRLSTLLALLRVLGGLNQVLGLIPLTQVSPLDSVDLGHERKKARRFGKRETSAKASK